MTLPTLVGHVDTYGLGGTTPLHRVMTPPSGTVDGDYMIVVMTSNAATYTPPSGWTQLYIVTTGTMKTTAWGKFRATGETAANATYDFTTSNSVADIETILAWHGVEPSLAHLVVGATGDRGTTGTSSTNVAPALTTTLADSKVYTFSHERTTTSETGITSLSSGTADYFKVQNGSSGLETFSLSHVDMPTIGTAPAVTVTYPNTQALNGLAVQIAIPGIVSGNVPPVAAFSGVVTGMSVAVTDTSTDSDGTVTGWDWDWGDGTTHGTGKTPSAHLYTTSGSKSITLTVTDNSSGTNAVSHSFSVNTFGQDIKYVDPSGAVKSAKMFYFDGTTKKDLTFDTITHISVPMTVDRFLNYPLTGPWEAAHRGFSYTYPEETLYSYRGATDRGVMAIELSCNMSLDGTWWAFHDAYLDRTVLSGNPTTTTLQISAMTDSAIAAYNNNGGTATANTSQPARPVAKVVDIINAYYKTHVIVIEDKTYTHTTAMLDLLDSYGTTDRPANQIFIWKATYDATKSTNFDAAAARGYHRWAYIFDANMVADFATLAASGKADMIGLDFHSSDATLLSAIAGCRTNGVKPTAHIITSAAQRDRLYALGVEGIMFANGDLLPSKVHVVKGDFTGVTQSASNGYLAAQNVSIFDSASTTFTVQILPVNTTVPGTWSDLTTTLVSGQYRGTQSLTAGQKYVARIKAVTVHGTFYSLPQLVTVV